MATKIKRPEFTAEYLGTVRTLAARLKRGGLFDFAGPFLGCQRSQGEAETMVVQTICAAAHHLDANNLPCSFITDNTLASAGAGLVDNGTAYGYLVANGWFAEEKIAAEQIQSAPASVKPSRSKKYTIIFPTQKLLDAVQYYLTKK